MVERKSPVRQADRCSIKGCEKEAERSLAVDAITYVGMDVEGPGKRAHLCKEHYKEYKKATRLDRKVENLGH